MNSEIIIMLTHNDKTVKNALEIFEDCKELSVKFWGFKDVGLPKDDMKELINAMKAAGKTTFLEVVTYTEEACMAGAKLAVEMGFDYLMGTLFYDSVWEYLKDKPIKYFPFVGDVSGSPSILKGTAEQMISQSEEFAKKGIHGTDILAYRHEDNPEELAEIYAKKSPIPCVIAGSISSEERLRVVNRIAPWGFTMGSALFTQNFVKDGSIKENLAEVLDLMDKIN